MTFIRNIDINTQHSRAAYLIVEDKDMFFGLAIRREQNNHVHRWAFYIGITEEEYLFFVDRLGEFTSISFLGLPSVSISIPQSITDMFGLQAPTRFIGVHYDSDPCGNNWSNESIVFMLEALFHFVREALRNEKAA